MGFFIVEEPRRRINEKQRIVVKIGSSSLTNSKGSIDEAKIREHVQAISVLKKRGMK